jgi:hypothetical protein
VAKPRRKYWSLNEAGREFGVHPFTISRQVDRLGIPTGRVGNVRAINVRGMERLRRHFESLRRPIPA